MALIEVENISHTFGDREALNALGLKVDHEIFALLGPNGGGKTTLFRILSTLLIPDSGTAQILGYDVVRRAREVRRHIGVVFQSSSLDRKLTVAENLTCHGNLYGMRGRGLRDRIAELLVKFGLSDRAGDRAEVLSGGLMRRVDIVKALLHRPEVLLLDEPSTGLDPGARMDLWEMLRETGATVLLTTHLLEEAEGAARIGILDHGRLVALGTADELKREIGGDVISLTSRSAEKLCQEIEKKFGGKASVLDGQVRIEQSDGHAFVARLVEAFPGEVESVTVRRPTLGDVFIRRTGRKFE